MSGYKENRNKVTKTVQTYQNYWVDKHKVIMGLKFLPLLISRALFSFTWLKVGNVVSSQICA